MVHNRNRYPLHIQGKCSSILRDSSQYSMYMSGMHMNWRLSLFFFVFSFCSWGLLISDNSTYGALRRQLTLSFLCYVIINNLIPSVTRPKTVSCLLSGIMLMCSRQERTRRDHRVVLLRFQPEHTSKLQVHSQCQSVKDPALALHLVEAFLVIVKALFLWVARPRRRAFSLFKIAFYLKKRFMSGLRYCF